MKKRTTSLLLVAFVAALMLLMAQLRPDRSNATTASHDPGAHLIGAEPDPGRTRQSNSTKGEDAADASNGSNAADRSGSTSRRIDARTITVGPVEKEGALEPGMVAVNLILGGAGREHIEGNICCTIEQVDPSSVSIEANSHEFDGPDIDVMLPPKRVKVLAWTECGLASEAIEFLPVEGLQVKLPALTRSDFEFQIFDYATAAAIGGCSIEVRRRLGGWQEPRGALFETGPDGTATVRARFGDNEVWVSKDGYTAIHSVADLPRPPFIAAGEKIASGPIHFWLDRPFELYVRLKGWEQLGPLEEFGVGGPPNHQRVPFSIEGLATLPIEYAFHPLPLKLWTAGNSTGIYYLDSAFPKDGDTYVIDLEAGVVVSVDLRLNREVEAKLADSDCVLSVNYHTGGGDAVTRGPSTTVSGVYEIPGVTAGTATVSFDVNLADGRVGSCASAHIQVNEGADATCVLNVDTLPIPVTIRGLNGNLLANVATEIVPSAFRTPWVTGGMTDNEGRIFLPSSGPEDLLFRAVWNQPGKPLLAAIDVPIRLHEVTKNGRLTLDPFEEVQVQLAVEGDMSAAATVQLIGDECPVAFKTIELRANEEPTPLLLASRSNAWLKVDKTDLWMRTRQLKVERPDLVFRGHYRGQLVVAPTVDLASIWSVEYRESLADWERMELLSAERTPEGTRVSLPVGWYEIIATGGDVTQRLYVTRSRVVAVR